MRLILCIVRILFVTGLVVIPTATAAMEVVSGKVVGVSDGDTVTVLDANMHQRKIRLAGIDAPEKKMPWGQRAKNHLSDLVYGRTVAVETSKKDRYGRWVGKVLLDGRDVNLVMVQVGMAWHYKQYSHEQSIDERRAYASAEDEARASGRGLWAQQEPVPPWDWRAAQR